MSCRRCLRLTDLLLCGQQVRASSVENWRFGVFFFFFFFVSVVPVVVNIKIRKRYFSTLPPVCAFHRIGGVSCRLSQTVTCGEPPFACLWRILTLVSVLATNFLFSFHFLAACRSSTSGSTLVATLGTKIGRWELLICDGDSRPAARCVSRWIPAKAARPPIGEHDRRGAGAVW